EQLSRVRRLKRIMYEEKKRALLQYVFPPEIFKNVHDLKISCMYEISWENFRAPVVDSLDISNIPIIINERIRFLC
ncbi:hypothetical protein AVEN_236832-1, partial [Araneus ventricosus]